MPIKKGLDALFNNAPYWASQLESALINGDCYKDSFTTNNAWTLIETTIKDYMNAQIMNGAVNFYITTLASVCPVCDADCLEVAVVVSWIDSKNNLYAHLIELSSDM